MNDRCLIDIKSNFQDIELMEETQENNIILNGIGMPRVRNEKNTIDMKKFNNGSHRNTQPENSENIRNHKDNIHETSKYDYGSSSSGIFVTRPPVSNSMNSKTKLRPSVEHEENMMEFLDVYKRVVSRHSMVFENSVFGKSNTDIRNKRKSNINEVERKRRNEILKLQKYENESQIDKNKTSSLIMKFGETQRKKSTGNSTSNLSSRNLQRKSSDGQPGRRSSRFSSMSNLSVRKPERKLLEQYRGSFELQSRSNLSIRRLGRQSSDHIERSFTETSESNSSNRKPHREFVGYHRGERSLQDLPELKREDESYKEEVEEVVESRKVPSSQLLQSKLREDHIKPFHQAASAQTREAQNKVTSDTSLGSDIHRGTKRSSILSGESLLGDDLRFILSHSEQAVDDTVIRRSIMELNGLVETETQGYTTDKVGKGKVPSLDHLPVGVSEVIQSSSFHSLNHDVEKGVAFKEEKEFLVYDPQVQNDSIQGSLGEDLSIVNQSKSPIQIYLGDSRGADEGDGSNDFKKTRMSSSLLEDYEYDNVFKYKYEGDYDANNLRTGFGCLEWISNERRKYCGYFQYNSLHGEGYYFIKRDGCFNFYDGKFYNNMLHGYGQIIYNNGDKFEGLFRENGRFGPGILSHEDGTEDVGVWYGNSIIRLSVHSSKCIPTLGKSIAGKLKLLQFKKMIPLKSTHNDTAYSVMENLNADEDSMKRYKELYNPQVRHSNSIFFDRSQFDHVYFGQEDFDIDVTDTACNPSDFIHLVKGKYSERFNEEYLIESLHTEKINEELNRLKKKIDSIKTQWKYCSDRLEKCRNGTNDDTQVNSLLQEELFLKNVLDFLHFKLETTRNMEELNLGTRQIVVDSLLAWNNGNTLIDILKHSFICRKSENNVSFNARNVLTGKRNEFSSAGLHERCCIKFLNTCASSDIVGALQLLANENINPNVGDSKGNTGLHLATWHHDLNIIRMLANHGANLDCVNDEGISPLNLCLLRCLESVYEVTNWESSFLYLDRSSVDLENLIQWRPCDSFWNLLQTQFNLSEHSLVSRKASRYSLKKKNAVKRSNKASHSSLENGSTVVDNFLFTLKFVSMPKRFEMEPIVKLGDSEVRQNGRDNSRETEKLSPHRMGEGVRTIESLLQYGADPNKEGVPYSPFFLALFSRSPETVECFMAAKADPNMNLYGMTPIQVITCLDPCDENCKILQILIHNCSNPNILSDPSIWQECDKSLLGDFEPECQIQPRGKDALHFICLREDFTDANNHFLCRMAEDLINSGLSTRALYLGHSHITMAIVKGNVALVECLSKYLDLRRPLGFYLGNSLTILALNRYQNILPFFVCQKMIDLLLEKVSPFEPLYDYCNIFEFLDIDSPPDLSENSHVLKQYISYVKSARAFLKTHLKENTDRRSNELSKLHVQEQSRKILDIINRFKAVFYLYCFIREGCLDQNTSFLAKLILNSKESLRYIRYIFKSGRMPRSYFSLEYVAQMMEYVDIVNDVTKKIEVKLQRISVHDSESLKESTRNETLDTVGVLLKKTSIKSDEVYVDVIKQQLRQDRPILREFSQSYYMEQLDESSFEECDDARFEDIHKWVTRENLIKSNVCYFCMHRNNKTLLRCPDCGIVKFCSNRCNFLSIELKTLHPCPGLFYQTIYNEYRDYIDNQLRLPIYGIDLAFANLRNIQKVVSTLRKNSKMGCLKSEDDSTKIYSPKSVKIRLHGGADKTQEYSKVLSPYDMKFNLPNANWNRDQRKEKNSTRYIRDISTKVKDNENFNEISVNKQYLGVNCKDYAKIFSLLPNIKGKKHQKLDVENEMASEKNFTTICRDRSKILQLSKNETGLKNSDEIQNEEKLSSDVQLVTLQKNDSSVKKIAIHLYHHFLDGLQDLDVESMFMPFTCFNGETIFHVLPAGSSCFYQPFDDHSLA